MSRFLLLVVMMLNSLNAFEYDNENNLQSFQPTFFVGIHGGYDYTFENDFDRINPSYGVYTGVPFLDFETIYKYKILKSNDFKSTHHSVSINKQIDGTGTRALYLGLVMGKSNIEFNSLTQVRESIVEKKFSDNFYGLHLGKRFKFSRKLYVRTEIEYLKYGYSIGTNHNTNLDIDNTLSFVYGVEYRF